MVTMCSMPNDVTAFVLAGGKSSRMVIIVGRRDKFAAHGDVVEDVYLERGPLGGIHAALAATTTELNLIIAVDVPCITADFLRHLLERARGSAATVTVPRAGGRLHPLSAVYRRGFRQRAEAALAAGRNKIDPLFTADETLILEEAELERLSFPATMFENVNTPEEYERARHGASQREHRSLNQRRHG